MGQSRSGGLWSNTQFMKLWIGQTVSLFGTQITRLALPLTAVAVFNVTPAEMSVLTTLQFLPFLLFGLAAGVWVDRSRRQPVLLTAEVGRSLLLASIPVLGLLGLLRLEYLYLVGFLIGVLTVFFDVAYQAFLPSLVARSQLVDGNSKLTFSDSAARMLGTGAGGVLIQLVTAPLAIIIDAVSYLISALLISLIRVTEPIASARRPQQSLLKDVGEGLTFVWREQALRTIAGAGITLNIFESIVLTFFVLYLTRDLALDAPVLGAVVIAGSIGSLAGTLLARKTVQRYGVSATLTAALGAIAAGRLLLPLAFGPPLLLLTLLFVSQIVSSMGGVVYNVAQISLRQAITPEYLQGRMNASLRFLVWGALPLGSLLGGVIGSLVGLKVALVVGSLGG
ncbi:MAG: MFS transporter, partial [Chloroflexales bacterium]|nr:MFS transporter [Chloroflexales bacterium]